MHLTRLRGASRGRTARQKTMCEQRETLVVGWHSTLVALPSRPITANLKTEHDIVVLISALTLAPSSTEYENQQHFPKEMVEFVHHTDEVESCRCIARRALYANQGHPPKLKHRVKASPAGLK